MGEDEIFEVFRENLKRALANVEKDVSEMWNSYVGCMHYYSNEMENWIHQTDGSAIENGLLNIHQLTKNNAKAKVWSQNICYIFLT